MAPAPPPPAQPVQPVQPLARPPWAGSPTFHFHTRLNPSFSAEPPAWDDADAFASSFRSRRPEVPGFVVEEVEFILAVRSCLNARCKALFDAFMKTYSAPTDVPETQALLFVCALERCLECSRDGSCSPSGHPPRWAIDTIAGGEFEEWLVTGMQVAKNPNSAMLRLSALTSFKRLLGDEDNQNMPESPQGSLYNFAELIETGSGSYQLGTYRRMGFSLLSVVHKFRATCCFTFVHPILTESPPWSSWFWLNEEYWAGRLIHGYSHEHVWDYCRLARERTLNEMALIP